MIREKEIVVFPDNGFNENKQRGPDNLIHVGDMSKDFENYFNSFFRKNWYGIVDTLEKFNKNTSQLVIGADPEYIEWCLRKGIIVLDALIKDELEKLEINRFKGIKISLTSNNNYIYHQIILKEYYKFPL